MNKYLQEFKDKYSLKASGNNVVYGVFNGYQVVVSLSNMNPADCFVRIYSNFREVKGDVESFLVVRKSEYKLRTYNFSNSTLTFDHTTLGVKGWVEKAEKILLELTEHLTRIQAKGVEYCPACGEKMDIPTKVTVHNNPLLLCTNCASKIQGEQEKAEEAYQAAPGNYGKGLLGAIVGALIGGVVWIAVAYVLGLVSAFIAVLITYLAAIGYDKMQGKQSQKKLVITTVVSLAVVVLSMYLSYVVMVNSALKAEGLTENPFIALAYLLETDNEIKASFISDMFMSLLFGTLGTIAYAQSMKKKLHK